MTDQLSDKSPIQRLLYLIFPKFGELTLFLMSIIFILEFIISPDLREFMLKLMIGKEKEVSYFLFVSFLYVIFISGIYFSLTQAFVEKPRSGLVKRTQLFFAIPVHGAIAVSAAIYILMHWDSPSNELFKLLIVFPILNLLNGIALLVSFSFMRVGVDHIKDDDTSRFEAILGGSVAIVIFIIFRYLYDMNWAIAFSICVTAPGVFATVIYQIVLLFFKGSSVSRNGKGVL